MSQEISVLSVEDRLVRLVKSLENQRKINQKLTTAFMVMSSKFPWGTPLENFFGADVLGIVFDNSSCIGNCQRTKNQGDTRAREIENKQEREAEQLKVSEEFLRCMDSCNP